MPDEYDDDADGDGIRNEMEREDRSEPSFMTHMTQIRHHWIPTEIHFPTFLMMIMTMMVA